MVAVCSRGATSRGCWSVNKIMRSSEPDIRCMSLSSRTAWRPLLARPTHSTGVFCGIEGHSSRTPRMPQPNSVSSPVVAQFEFGRGSGLASSLKPKVNRIEREILRKKFIRSRTTTAVFGGNLSVKFSILAFKQAIHYRESLGPWQSGLSKVWTRPTRALLSGSGAGEIRLGRK